MLLRPIYVYCHDTNIHTSEYCICNWEEQFRQYIHLIYSFKWKRNLIFEDTSSQDRLKLTEQSFSPVVCTFHWCKRTALISNAMAFYLQWTSTPPSFRSAIEAYSTSISKTNRLFVQDCAVFMNNSWNNRKKNRLDRFSLATCFHFCCVYFWWAWHKKKHNVRFLCDCVYGHVRHAGGLASLYRHGLPAYGCDVLTPLERKLTSSSVKPAILLDVSPSIYSPFAAHLHENDHFMYSHWIE